MLPDLSISVENSSSCPSLNAWSKMAMAQKMVAGTPYGGSRGFTF